VIPDLFAGKPAGEAVWVCGCSTGEEAYSIAILIQKHLETLKQTFKVQVFATDVPAEWLARFFTQDAAGGVYHDFRPFPDESE
jgi:two-component system, chemotaxis family, CheB/CheR fusion protein